MKKVIMVVMALVLALMVVPPSVLAESISSDLFTYDELMEVINNSWLIANNNGDGHFTFPSVSAEYETAQVYAVKVHGFPVSLMVDMQFRAKADFAFTTDKKESLEKATFFANKLLSAGRNVSGATFIDSNKLDDIFAIVSYTSIGAFASDGKETNIVVFPVAIYNKEYKILDDHMYIFVGDSSPSTSSAWFCSDQESVYTFIGELLSVINVQDTDEDEYNRINDWYMRHTPGADTEEANKSSTNESEHASKETKASEGEKTARVISDSTVNIRSKGSTDGAVVGKASPGQVFPVLGEAATGWIEIALPDGASGFISPKMVTVEEN